MGKEKIYTIPVTEAFKQDCECPLCAMLETLDELKIEFVLGTSYMEDDIRGRTNELGFCKKHYTDLNAGKNRLGLALILQTHMMALQNELNQLVNNTTVKGTKGFFKGNKSEGQAFLDFAQEKQESCYICEEINRTFDIYVDTFFYLWKSDSDFIKLVSNCKGFCISHFLLLLETGSKKLKESDYEAFRKIIIPLQTENYQRVLSDIDWFVTKFDYRNQNQPWKNSQDAIPRAIKKVAGLKL